MFNKDWNYLNHLCPFSFSFCVCFFFLFYFQDVGETRGWMGGELWLFWTLCRWIWSQYIVISVSYELLKNSKSASSNIKPNPNPDCWSLPVANYCRAAHCLGFYVLTVALKHITWLHCAVWLCQGINEKWGVTYFLTLGNECVIHMWPCRKLYFHLRLVSSNLITQERGQSCCLCVCVSTW